MSISSFLLCCRCAFWDGNLIQPKGLGLMDAFATGCGFNWINSKPGQCNSCKEQWKISIVSSKVVACWGDDQSIHHIQFDVEVTVVNKICLLIRTMEMKPQNTKSGLCYNTPSSQSFKSATTNKHVDHPMSPHSENKGQKQKQNTEPILSYPWKMKGEMQFYLQTCEQLLEFGEEVYAFMALWKDMYKYENNIHV